MEHVVSVHNVSRERQILWAPECTCGWRGWNCSSKSVAQQDAMTHRQKAVMNGDVEADPRLS
jgi:hypothetical protein